MRVRKLLVGEFYLRAAVLTCGSDQVETCAGDILPVVNRAVEQLQTNWPELWETLQVQKLHEQKLNRVRRTGFQQRY